MKKSSPRFTQLVPVTTTKYNSIIRALDTTTQQSVIIKTPRVAYITDSRICDNLLHEMNILHLLKGMPAIQDMVASGIQKEAEKEIPYMVTVEAPGKNLYETVRDNAHNGRFTFREGLELIRACAQALFSAHELGIVHCDLKLGNILWDGNAKSAVLMDWAAATHLPTQKRSSSDPVLGTSQFMSYEHVTGQMLDARTDIYALGIIATLLIYGQELTPRYAIANGKTTKRNKEETADAVAKKETIKTDLFPLPESALDWNTRQLLKRMTQWDRELRPRSMQDVVEECTKILG